MHMKNLALTSAVVFALLNTSMASANQNTATVASPQGQYRYHKAHNRLLTAKQQQELHAILHEMNQQMIPLLKTKEALNLQIRGKIAAPNTQWRDIASLVNQLNENNAKITTLFAKTQLSTFQKLGVLLPSPHAGHSHQRHIV